MRGQLVGVVIAAPLFLAVLAILGGVSTLHAASDFVANEVPRLTAKGVALGSDRANEAANDTITEAPLRPLAAGFGLGGQIGFVVAMVYTSLYAMRTGLLTRFWGSAGIALGAVSFIFFQFTLLWFIYFGALLMGWVPGGKPPAWTSGEAEPWPTPAEKAAAELEPAFRRRAAPVGVERFRKLSGTPTGAAPFPSGFASPGMQLAVGAPALGSCRSTRSSPARWRLSGLAGCSSGDMWPLSSRRSWSSMSASRSRLPAWVR